MIGMCRCFARVDVNGTRTLYRSFARVNIHVDVIICKDKYSREYTLYRVKN